MVRKSRKYGYIPKMTCTCSIKQNSRAYALPSESTNPQNRQLSIHPTPPQKYIFFIIRTIFNNFFENFALSLVLHKSPSAYGIPIRTVLILRDLHACWHAAGSVHTALFTTTSLLVSCFLFFQFRQTALGRAEGEMKVVCHLLRIGIGILFQIVP